MKKSILIFLSVNLIASASKASCVLPYSQLLTTVGAHQDANATSLKTEALLAVVAGITLRLSQKKYLFEGVILALATMAVIHAIRYELAKIGENHYRLILDLLGDDPERSEKVLTEFTQKIGLEPTAENKRFVGVQLIQGFMNNTFCPNGVPMDYEQVAATVRVKMRGPASTQF